jgi:hypothetical protein
LEAAVRVRVRQRRNNLEIAHAGDVDRQRRTRRRRDGAVEARVGRRHGARLVDQDADAYGAGGQGPVLDHLPDGWIGDVDRLHDSEPQRMGVAHRNCVGGVVSVHGEGGDQDRRIDAGFVHRCDEVVAGDFRRPRQGFDPRAAGVIALVGMYLSVNDRHGDAPLRLSSLRHHALHDRLKGRAASSL